MAGETILIIEDRRENIVHLANNVLKPKGYRVLTAMDGQRGLKRALTEKPDLIIMDLKMPKMDGLEVLAALRERQVDTPVILTTFYGSEQVAEQALRLGAAAYIVKPFSVHEMLEAVEAALAQRATAQPPPAPVRRLPEAELPEEQVPMAALPEAEVPVTALPEVDVPVTALPEAEMAATFPPPAEMPVAELDEAMPLTRQVERWMRDMNILTRIGKALVAQLDMDKVCARAVEATIYLTRADHAFLFLRKEVEGGGLCLCATRGPHDRHVRFVGQPVTGGLVAQVDRTGKTLIQSSGEGDPFLREVAGGRLGPVAAMPLRWQKEASGVLVAARSPEEYAFGEADVEWLSGLADYVAIALLNAQAFQRCAERAEAGELASQRAAGWQRELDDLVTLLQSAAETALRLTDMLNPEDTGAGQAADE